MPDLSASAALITGAGREPARALALALAGTGCRLALNDLTPLRLDETAAQARALGGQVSTHVGDSSKGLFARGLLEEALEAWDQVNVLVNCPLAEPRLPLIDLDEWDFQRTLEANTGGPFLLMQLLSRWLHAEGRAGTILNLITARPSVPPQPGREAFYTSQMALSALTASAAPGLSALGIRIYGISAGELQAQAAAAQALRLLDPQCPASSGTIIDLWGPD
jgi:NAD(P)-dependent dehydrogenase (short-subunit alcohol dehydrogenase family)